MKPNKLPSRSKGNQERNYQYVDEKKEDFCSNSETEFYLKEKYETEKAKNELRKLSECIFDEAEDEDKRMMTEMEDSRSWRVNSHSIVCNELLRVKSHCDKIVFRRNNTLGTMRNKEISGETSINKKETLVKRINSTSKQLDSFKENLKHSLSHETPEDSLHSAPLSKHCSIIDEYETQHSTISIKKKSNDPSEKKEKQTTLCSLKEKKKLAPTVSFVMTSVHFKTEKFKKLKFQRSETVHSGQQEKASIAKKFYIKKANNTKVNGKSNKLSVFGICKKKNENKHDQNSNIAMKENYGHNSTPEAFNKQNENEHKIMRLREEFEKLRRLLKKEEKPVHNIDDIPIKICQLKI